MSIELLRTVEHTFIDGEQAVVTISKITRAPVIDNSGTYMLIGTPDNSVAVSVHSGDQLDRLIAALRSLRRGHFDGLDDAWTEVDR